MGPDVEQMNFEKPAVAQSRAEGANSNEGLDADAARYRWIRENISADLEWYLLGTHGNGADGLDAAIDAAITKAANAKVRGCANTEPQEEN